MIVYGLGVGLGYDRISYACRKEHHNCCECIVLYFLGHKTMHGLLDILTN